jgi:hypothetical protein
MWDRLSPRLEGLRELQLYETDDAAVIYRGEPDGASQANQANQANQESPAAQ